jgi:hypothetical protein
MLSRALAGISLLVVVTAGCSNSANQAASPGVATSPRSAASVAPTAVAGTTEGLDPGPAGQSIEYAYAPVCNAQCHSAASQAVADSAHCVAPDVPVWVSSQVVGSGKPYALAEAPICLPLPNNSGVNRACTKWSRIIAEGFRCYSVG